MRFGRTIALLVLMSGLWPAPEASAVEIGTARVNVIQELGEPAAAIARGDSEVFTYRNGVKIKFKNGRVTEIRDASGLTTREWQLIGFPFQFIAGRSWRDWLFLGGGLRQVTSQPEAPYLIGGVSGQLGAVRIVAGGQWDCERDEARLLLTVQYFL